MNDSFIRRYRRDGTPYPPTKEGLFEWAYNLEDPAYRIVRQDTLPVWLGLNHQWGQGPPLIFETMVFHSNHSEDYQRRYSTEDDAIVGHLETIDLYAATVVGHLRDNEGQEQ